MRSILFTIPGLDFDVPAFGVMMMIGVVGAVWWAARRAEKVKIDGEIIVNLGLIVLISSIVGARTFYVIHYWEQFAGRGLLAIINVRQGGIEFYGGFIGACVATFAFFWFRRLPARLFLDIMIPSVAFGLSMGRIGCFLHGCCFGAVCSPDLPWAVTFPYEAPSVWRQWEDRQVTVPREMFQVNSAGVPAPVLLDREELRALGLQPIRSHAVHPAQLYASIDAMFLAIILHIYFFRRKRDGMVFAWFLLTYPVIRFIEEAIRGDNPHDTLHLTISQFVSVVLFLLGVGMMIALRYLPARCTVPESALTPRVREQREQQQAASKKRNNSNKKNRKRAKAKR